MRKQGLQWSNLWISWSKRQKIVKINKRKENNMQDKELKFGQLNDSIAKVREDVTNFVGELVQDNGGSISLADMEKIGYIDDEGVSNLYQPEKIYFDEKGDLLLSINDGKETFNETFADITFNEMYDVMVYLFTK
jgi:hypothetical protein